MSQEMRGVLRAKGLVPAGVLLDLGVQMTAAEDRQRSKNQVAVSFICLGP